MGWTWNEVQPLGDTDANYYRVRIDTDGSDLLVATTTRLYASANSGSSWTEQQPAGATDKDWRGLDINSDGSKMIAAAYNGRVYKKESGSWSETQPVGALNRTWVAAVVSRTGSVYAVSEYDDVHVYNGSWGGNMVSTVQDNPYYQGLTIDDDGNCIWLAGYDEYNDGCDTFEYFRVWVSSNYGVSWSLKVGATVNNSDNTHWIECDSTGVKVIAGCDSSSYGAYITLNSFTDKSNKRTSNAVKQRVCSGDGAMMMIVDNYRIYYTTDQGDTWTETRPVGDVNKWWKIAVSSDGTKAIAGVNAATGRLYYGEYTATADDNAPLVASEF